MKIFSANLTREADNYTIKHEPISSVDLMERAGKRCFNKINELYPDVKDMIVFAGPGNNGGDGLVIARLSAERNIEVKLIVLHFTDNFSLDFKVNLNRLKDQNKVEILKLKDISDFPIISKEYLIVDAIFGSGLTRVLKGFPEEVVKKINETDNHVVAVDIPSGLFGEDNAESDKTAVKANHTITFQYPSLSFLFPENEDYIGQFHVVDIGIHEDFIEQTASPFYYLQKEDLKFIKRNKFSHKGNFGHALIIAGSYEKAGASVLAVKAAQRAGAGLVTACVPKCNYQILQISSPETMLCIDTSEEFLSIMPDLTTYSSVAIGPGIGFNNLTKELLHQIILKYKNPIVFDADAITILSENKAWLKDVPVNSIFTPHPKEFERLVGKSANNYERLQMQINFSVTNKVFVLQKGAYSSISTPKGSVYFNSTGNPGMATGGSGDVLTGMIASLLAQNYSPKNAILFGTYIHGLSGDFAAENLGQNALNASDIISYLSEAFKSFEL